MNKRNRISKGSWNLTLAPGDFENQQKNIIFVLRNKNVNYGSQIF